MEAAGGVRNLLSSTFPTIGGKITPLGDLASSALVIEGVPMVGGMTAAGAATVLTPSPYSAVTEFSSGDGVRDLYSGSGDRSTKASGELLGKL